MSWTDVEKKNDLPWVSPATIQVLKGNGDTAMTWRHHVALAEAHLNDVIENNTGRGTATPIGLVLAELHLRAADLLVQAEGLRAT